MPEPTHTTFAGLIRIPPAEPLSLNGFEFQYIDPVIIDRLLQLGAVTHTHDGALALPNPAGVPTVTAASTGGTIDGGETVTIAYTLVDEDGGETLASPTKAVTTASTGTDPAKAPTAAVSYAAGSLLAGNYYYGVTITDGAGGESGISPEVEGLVEPSYAKAQVTIGGLKAILTETGGVEWRLWRMQGGGPWNLIAKGTAETIVDDGTLVPDCTVEPPLASTTHGTSTITVTVPNPSQPRAHFFRVYASTTAEFGSESLLGEYPSSEFAKAIVFTSLAPEIGQPPPVTRCYPHAKKITPEAFTAFPWRKPVTKYSELPATENEEGDMRLVTEEQAIYIWNNVTKAWQRLVGEEIVSVGYAISGAIAVGIQPGVYLSARAHARVRLIGIYADIAEGTQCVVNVRKNGTVLTGYKEITITKGKKEFESAEVAVADKDKIDIEVVSVTGEPKSLTLSLQLGYR